MYSINFYLIAFVSAFIDSDIITVHTICKIEVLKEMNVHYVLTNQNHVYIVINIQVMNLI